MGQRVDKVVAVLGPVVALIGVGLFVLDPTPPTFGYGYSVAIGSALFLYGVIYLLRPRHRVLARVMRGIQLSLLVGANVLAVIQILQNRQ